MDPEKKTELKDRYSAQDWLTNYERDLRDSISPDDNKSNALVNIWTGLAHISNDSTVPDQVRTFFATVGNSINSFGLNAVNRNGEIIHFPKFSSASIKETIPSSTAEHDYPQKPISE